MGLVMYRVVLIQEINREGLDLVGSSSPQVVRDFLRAVDASANRSKCLKNISTLMEKFKPFRYSSSFKTDGSHPFKNGLQVGL